MSGLISVIVPVHNGEAFLSDCLESLVRQTWRQLEILVIDDGSTDGSAALCRRWQEKDGRIRFFQKENGGVSSARNLGLEMARGEYAAFVDADDWLLPGMLQEQLEQVMATLTEREQRVLEMRFGLLDGQSRTLEEVGKEFQVTRERIRQIESKALRKLRHPSRSRKLRDFLE